MTNHRPLPLSSLIPFLVVVLLAAACGGSDSVDIGDGGAAQPDPTDAPGDGAIDGDTTRPTLRGIWVLRSFTLDGADVPLPEGPIDMEIELGRIGGTGGCNSFGGTIDAADDGGLAIGEMGWTEMACADPTRMDFESAYLPALTRVNRWEASPTGIVFRSDSAVLTYAPGDPPTTLPLEGTVWTFDTVFSGAGVDRAASSTDQSQPQVSVVIDDGVATLTAADCGTIMLPLNYETGSEGNLNVGDDVDVPSCDQPGSNMTVAIDGFVEATGFMVDENRLTLIGLPGELLGFRGES